MEEKRIVIDQYMRDDVVEIYYPDGELIVKTDNNLIIDDVRAQIYGKGIEGCYAMWRGKRVEIDSDTEWNINRRYLYILDKLHANRAEFRKKYKK